MLSKKKVLFVKVEAAEGQAEAMDPAVDGVLILEGGGITPEGSPVGSARLSATLSKEPHKIGQLSLGLTAPCELRGGGVSGDAVQTPDFDDMLRASAMKRTTIEFVQADGATLVGSFTRGEVITGGTSGATGILVAHVGGGLLMEPATGNFQSGETLSGGDSGATMDSNATPITGHQYMPTSKNDEMVSNTAVFYLDGHKFTVSGARNTWSMNLPVGEKPTIEFVINGRWNDPVQESNPTPTLLDTDAPLVVNMGLKVGDYAPMGVTSIAIDMAGAVNKAMDVNAPDGLRAFNVTDRTPAGSFDPEAETLNNYNPWSAWKSGDLSELSFLLGNVPGNRIFAIMPKIQRTSVGYGDRDGTVVYDESFDLKRDLDGDDEIRLIFF